MKRRNSSSSGKVIMSMSIFYWMTIIPMTITTSTVSSSSSCFVSALVPPKSLYYKPMSSSKTTVNNNNNNNNNNYSMKMKRNSLTMYFDDVSRSHTTGWEGDKNGGNNAWQIRQSVKIDNHQISTNDIEADTTTNKNNEHPPKKEHKFGQRNSQEKMDAVQRMILGFNAKSASELSEKEIKDHVQIWAKKSGLVGNFFGDEIYDEILGITICDGTTPIECLAQLWSKGMIRDFIDGYTDKYHPSCWILPPPKNNKSNDSFLQRKLQEDDKNNQKPRSLIYMCIFPNCPELYDYKQMFTLMAAVEFSKNPKESFLHYGKRFEVTMFHPKYKNSPNLFSPEYHSPFPIIGFELLSKSHHNKAKLIQDQQINKYNEKEKLQEKLNPVENDDDDDDDYNSITGKTWLQRKRQESKNNNKNDSNDSNSSKSEGNNKYEKPRPNKIQSYQIPSRDRVRKMKEKLSKARDEIRNRKKNKSDNISADDKTMSNSNNKDDEDKNKKDDDDDSSRNSNVYYEYDRSMIADVVIRDLEQQKNNLELLFNSPAAVTNFDDEMTDSATTEDKEEDDYHNQNTNFKIADAKVVLEDDMVGSDSGDYDDFDMEDLLVFRNPDLYSKDDIIQATKSWIEENMEYIDFDYDNEDNNNNNNDNDVENTSETIIKDMMKNPADQDNDNKAAGGAASPEAVVEKKELVQTRSKNKALQYMDTVVDNEQHWVVSENKNAEHVYADVWNTINELYQLGKQMKHEQQQHKKKMNKEEKSNNSLPMQQNSLNLGDSSSSSSNTGKGDEEWVPTKPFFLTRAANNNGDEKLDNNINDNENQVINSSSSGSTSSSSSTSSTTIISSMFISTKFCKYNAQSFKHFAITINAALKRLHDENNNNNNNSGKLFLEVFHPEYVGNQGYASNLRRSPFPMIQICYEIKNHQ